MQPQRHANITEVSHLSVVHHRIFLAAADNRDELLIQPHSSRDVWKSSSSENTARDTSAASDKREEASSLLKIGQTVAQKRLLRGMPNNLTVDLQLELRGRWGGTVDFWYLPCN